ncbi:hypothetical protein FQN49_000230 [Arthroderma sp. PD_2]|nr:hypothetical protein FQN49_000230 [Arthroderma sp. PD_2]
MGKRSNKAPHAPAGFYIAVILIDLESPNGDDGTFAWTLHPKIPQLPPAVVEELGKDEISCSEDNDERNTPGPTTVTQDLADTDDVHRNLPTIPQLQRVKPRRLAVNPQVIVPDRDLEIPDRDLGAKSDRVANVQDGESDIEQGPGGETEPGIEISNYDIDMSIILEHIITRLGYNVEQKLEDLSSEGYLELDGVFVW